VFRGNHALNMDAKGRLTILTKLRDPLIAASGGELVVTVDPFKKKDEYTCLFILPLPKWKEVEMEVCALPTAVRGHRKMQRLLIGHARDVEMDKGGRVLVPPELRSYADLDKEVVLVGQGQRYELWNKESWEAECLLDDDSDEDFADLQSLQLSI